jgi:pSer/pThr/pTyr-binding forkhead associated (FHA) protein
MPTAPCFYIKDQDKITGQLDLTQFPFTIGRGRDCDYVVDSSEISRQHAQLDFDQQKIVLQDLGSTNGTFLNGERIIPNKQYRLRANDIVSLANVHQLIFDDPATTEQLDVSQLAEGLQLDETTSQASVRGEALEPPLSPSQILLLQLLLRNEGIVVTRDQIRQHVWGDEANVSDQAMDALISRLRKRLHEADPEHEYIVTRRGFGLVFRNLRPEYR